jgi:hypothetical protein
MKQAVMIAPGKIEETSHSLPIIELRPDDLREIEGAASTRLTVQGARRLSAPNTWSE